MPLSHGPTFFVYIGPYLSPTVGNQPRVIKGPDFLYLSGQLPVPVVTVCYGMIYVARSNDKRERETDNLLSRNLILTRGFAASARPNSRFATVALHI